MTETVRLDALVGRLRLIAAWQKNGGPMPTEPMPNQYKTAMDAAEEIERLRIGYRRYETARLMNPRAWSEAWNLNITTGKPFDEIIDELRPFVVPNARVNPGAEGDPVSGANEG